MKTAVVYRSKTGFTKKYAEWIAKALSADLLEGAKTNVDMLLGYDTVIYGGGLYAGGINGVKLITTNLIRLDGKRLVVFACGACPGRPEECRHMIEANFSPQQLLSIKFFYLRGGYDHDKLPLIDRIAMLMLKAKIKLKSTLGLKLVADERGMLNAYDKPVDFSKEQNIAELLEYARR